MAKKTLKKGKKNRKTKKRGGWPGQTAYRLLHHLSGKKSKGQIKEENKAKEAAEAEEERKNNPKKALEYEINNYIRDIENKCASGSFDAESAVSLVEAKISGSPLLSEPEKERIRRMLNKIKNSEECKQSGKMQQSHMRSAYVRDLSDREEINYDATRDFSAPFYDVEEKIKEIIDKCKSETVYPESYIERLKEEILTSTLLNKEEKRELQIKLLTAKNSQNCKQLKQNQKKNGDHSSRGVNVREESRIGDGKPKRRQPVYKHNGETALLTNRSKPSEHLPAEPDVQSKPEPEPKLKPDYSKKDFNKLMSDKKADIKLMIEDETAGNEVMNVKTGKKYPKLYVALYSLRDGMFNIYGKKLPEDKKQEYIILVDETIPMGYLSRPLSDELKRFS
jgi:hypothetical protein